MEDDARRLVAKYGLDRLLILAEVAAWERFEELRGDATIEGGQKCIAAAGVAEKIGAARKLLK